MKLTDLKRCLKQTDKMVFNYPSKMLLFILLIISLLNCDKIRLGTPGELLKAKETYSLKIPEPSGLSLSADKKFLWTVSDRNSTVYLMTLNGDILKKFKVPALDLEGITVINENVLAVLSEETSEIIFADTSGNIKERKKIKVPGKNFDNLEGLTFDHKKNRFFAVNKSSPVALIEINFNTDEIHYAKNDSLRDLSGISYCSDCNCLWILSDSDKSIVKYKPGENLQEGEMIQRYKTNIRQAEGITVDCENNRIYIVSDYTEKLYVFEIE